MTTRSQQRPADPAAWPLRVGIAGFAATALLVFALAPVRGSATTVAVALTLLVGVPGYLVCAALRLRLDGSPWGIALASFGLGTGVVVLISHLALLSGAAPRSIAQAVVAFSVLPLGALFVQWRRGTLVAFGLADRSLSRLVADAAVLVIALPLVVGYLTHVRYETGGGDWWIYTSYIEWFVAEPGAAYLPHSPGPEEMNPRLLTSGWIGMLAALVDLVRVDTPALDVFWQHLPPVLLVLTVASVYALACALFRDALTPVCVAFAQALVALATVTHFGFPAGARYPGFTIFYRLPQDKVFLAFILVPIAGMLAVHALRERRPGLFVAFGAVGCGAALTHPLGLPFVAISTGPYALLRAALARTRRDWLATFALGAVLLPSIAWPLVNAARGEAPNTIADERRYQRRAHLLGDSMMIFSREENDFIAHWLLIAHPLLAAGVAIGLSRGFAIRRRADARFVFAATLMPLLLMYVPGVPPLAGRILTPWLIWRFSWMLPTALAIGFGLERSIALIRFAAKGPQPAVRVGTVLSAGIVLAWVIQLPHDLHDASEFLYTPPEPSLEPMRSVSHAISDKLDGHQVVLMPRALQQHVIALDPHVKTLYWRPRAEPAAYAEIRSFYAANRIGPAEIDFLTRHGVDWIVVHPAQRAYHALVADAERFEASPIEGHDYRIFRLRGAPGTD